MSSNLYLGEKNLIMSLIDNITRENGYRPSFITFARQNIHIPAIYRWVSLLEDERLGKPEAITNQKLLKYLNAKDRWIDLLLTSNSLKAIDRLVLEYEKAKSKFVKPNKALQAKFALKALSLGIPPAGLSSLKTIEDFENIYGVKLRYTRRWKSLPYKISDTPNPAKYPAVKNEEEKRLKQTVDASKKDRQNRKKLKDSILSEIKKYEKTYNYNEVATATRVSFKAMNLQFLDGKFTALPLSVWNKILLFSQIDKIDYISVKRDCDNFAIALAGECSLKFGINGVGIVVDTAGRHAYNVLLVEGKEGLEVAIVEPQSDGFVQIGDKLSNAEAYTGKKGFILFA